MSNAMLVLEDGRFFCGESIGIKGVSTGQIFFDTRLVGYQETMTDPANAGKILVLTYPLIGNYGVNDKFNQSDRAWVNGLVIKEKSRGYSNWQAKGSLDEFLKRGRLVAIAEVDTRTLVVHLRDKAQIWAAISTNGKTKEQLLKEIKTAKQNAGKSLIKTISTNQIRISKGKKGLRVGVLDLGVTRSLTTQLKNLGLEIALLPYYTPAEQILNLRLKGLIISGGPEEDSSLREVVLTVEKLIGRIAMLGISLGCQVIAKALGAKIYKMRSGHHGVNYPIRRPDSFRGEITVQNHSWAVDLDSLKRIKGIRVSALHLNDATVEEFESQRYKIIAAQYYPASPGFDEVSGVLIKFLQLMNPALPKGVKDIK